MGRRLPLLPLKDLFEAGAAGGGGEGGASREGPVCVRLLSTPIPHRVAPATGHDACRVPMVFAGVVCLLCLEAKSMPMTSISHAHLSEN